MRTIDRQLERALDRARRQRTLPSPIERRLLRLRAGLSQGEVGESIGTTAAAVSRYESGLRQPRGVIVEKYRVVLARLSRESVETSG